MSTTVTITQEVSSCRTCPKSTNTSREHDDPFTSAPHPCIWYCQSKGGPDVIRDENKIDPACPLLKQQQINTLQ